MSRSRQRGMSLMELVVYCAILGIFTTMLFMSLPGRDNATLEAVTDTSVKGEKLLSDLGLEIGNSSLSSVTILSNPPGAVFLAGSENGRSRFTYTASGALAWKGWVGYLLEGGKLTRYWLALPAAVERSSVGAVPTVARLKAGKARLLLNSASSFSIVNSEPNVWQTSLEIAVKRSSVAVTTAVSARNP